MIGEFRPIVISVVLIILFATLVCAIVPHVDTIVSLASNGLCDANESGVSCIREWISPVAAVFTVAAIWYAARSVVEANRASDAAVRSTLDSFRAQLALERSTITQIMDSDEVKQLNLLRQTTRGGWIHAQEEFGALKPILDNCSGFAGLKKSLEAPAFGGELGQRRKELSLLIGQIDTDYFRCRTEYERDETVSAEILDNIRFRTKAFLGMLHSYQIVVDEEIEVTAEAINEYDDENLHRVRKAIIDRAERQWSKRRKGIFERFIDKISVSIKPIDRPKHGHYFEDPHGISGRTPSPHHVDQDYEIMPKRSRKKS